MAEVVGSKVSGSLENVLKFVRTAWYEGHDGTRAYMEYPIGKVKGLIAVNGKQIMRLVDNGSERLTEAVLKELEVHGVRLESGWVCLEPLPPGMHIHEARKRSRYEAVRHYSGNVIIQCLSTGDRLSQESQQCAIFVDGQRHWTVKVKEEHQMIAEMGLVTWCGWFPLQEDVLAREGRGRR